MTNGILCIDKPAGMTSFDVVAVMRRLLGEKKAGHSGTLDPMATGVLPLFFGRATKAIGLLPDTDKRYSARLRLGVTTDTGDSTGHVMSRTAVALGRRELEAALGPLRGEIEQVPPMVSALKVGGKKLYELARQGIEVERAPRKVTIYSLVLTQADEAAGEYGIDVHCSKGTYIRTLCEAIGAALGCGATMTALRRTMAAGFPIESCLTLEEARRLAQEGSLVKRIQNVESAFIVHKVINITGPQAVRFCNGGALALQRLEKCPASGVVRVHAPGGAFLGLGTVDAQRKELRTLYLYRLQAPPAGGDCA